MSTKLLNAIEVDGGTTGVSGIKMTRVNSSTTPQTAAFLGVDASGNVVRTYGIPIGSVIFWVVATIPVGFLECDGAAISRVTYATLFALFGTTFGVGDGSTTFNLPDSRERSVFTSGATNTPGTKTGSDTVDISHTHGVGTLVNGTPSGVTNASLIVGGTVASNNHTHTISGSTASGGSTTLDKRPARFYMRVLVKAL